VDDIEVVRDTAACLKAAGGGLSASGRTVSPFLTSVQVYFVGRLLVFCFVFAILHLWRQLCRNQREKKGALDGYE
jgi:hypothetical protein